jgi:polyisoprenoid-binding protein YceI
MTEATAVRTVNGTTAPAAGTYGIDASHSVVEFVARHLGLAKVRGRFNEFEGTILVAEDIADSRVDVTIKADTIDTRDAGRDEHLRSADFLNAEQFGTLEFHSTAVRSKGDNWQVDGDLTIAGRTRPVALDVEFEGSAQDPWGNARIGFSASTKINREDFGLTWNQALETGGWLVGKEVKIELGVEGIRSDTASAA